MVASFYYFHTNKIYFSNGLQLQMGTLQSRLDAEFLLAHMCSVKFKEWIVVLATLLRRSEVPLPLTVHTSLVALFVS